MRGWKIRIFVLALLGIRSFPDFCGVAGFLVSIVGLLVVWKEAHAAKSAAQQAADAAEDVRKDLNKFDVVNRLSETIMELEEAKTLQRYGVWVLLPAAYSGMIKSLMTVKKVGPLITNAHRKAIQSAIQTCASIEDEIETAISQEAAPQDVPRMNRTLNAHIMELQEVLLHIRNQVTTVAGYLILAAVLLLAVVFVLTDSWTAKLMALAVALELWVAQYWHSSLLDLQTAYWRDTGTLRKQIGESPSGRSEELRFVLDVVFSCPVCDSTRIQPLASLDLSGMCECSSLNRHRRSLWVPQLSITADPLLNYHIEAGPTPYDFI